MAGKKHLNIARHQSVLALLVLIIVLTYAGVKIWGPPRAGWNAWDIRLELPPGFQVAHRENYHERLALEKITATGPQHELLRIQRSCCFPQTAATSYMQNRLTQLLSLYRPWQDRYSSPLTGIVHCPAPFLPEYKTEKQPNMETLFMLADANGSYAVGACTEQTYAYKAALFFVYCTQQKSIYSIEYFVPKQNWAPEKIKFLKSFQCI